MMAPGLPTTMLHMLLPHMLLHTLAPLVIGRMLNSAVEGTVLAGLLWLVLRLFGRQSTGSRFAILLVALGAMVALPFFSGGGWGSGKASPQAALPAALPAMHGFVIFSVGAALFLLIVWAAGASMLLLRLGVGLWRLRRYRRNCVEMDRASLDPEIRALVLRLESQQAGRGSLCRRVRLCVSHDLAVPAAIGFLKPAIVFPAWLLPELSAGEFEIVLLHELAHLRRGDQWTNLAQKIVKAVFFFHPAVWWLDSRLSLEREMACDDLVLAHTASPRAYASFLISFAEKLQGGHGSALVQALVSRMRQMSLRIAQILDSKRVLDAKRAHAASWTPAPSVSVATSVAMSVTMAALVLAAAPNVPSLVVFRNQSGQDLPRLNQPRQNQPRQNQPRQNQPRQNQPRQNQPRQNQPRQNQPRREQILAVHGQRPEAERQPQPAHAVANTVAGRELARGVVRDTAGAAFEGRAIPAAYHPRATAASRHASPDGAPHGMLQRTAAPAVAQAIRATAGSANPAPANPAPANAGNEGGTEETIIILEASQPDASGGATWTLCVWRVEAGSARERALASAIVVGSI